MQLPYSAYTLRVKATCQETNQNHKMGAPLLSSVGMAISRSGQSLKRYQSSKYVAMASPRSDKIGGKPAGDAILSSLEQSYATRYYLLAEEPCET